MLPVAAKDEWHERSTAYICISVRPFGPQTPPHAHPPEKPHRREAKRGGRSKHLSETLGGTVYLLSPTKNNHKQVLFNTGLDEVLQRCRLPIAVITA